MKKMNKTTVAIMWILAFAPLILVAATYGALPELVPHNWGFNGQITYGDKANLWWFAGMSPALAALLMLLPRIDPRKKNYQKFMGFYNGFCVFMMLFLFGMVALVVSESLKPGRISVSTAVAAACGLLFALIGNMMPKVKSNFFVGIRTPWALSNSEVWNRTNRLAGYLFFFGGIVIIVSAFFLPEEALFATLMVIAAAAALVPGAMSYVWYRRLTVAERDTEDPV